MYAWQRKNTLPKNHLPTATRPVVPRVMVSALAIGCVLAASPSCSSENREGPDVTCADLGDGAWNACRDGIIASCSDGKVRYEVCEERDWCEVSYQYPGAYVCNRKDEVENPIAVCGLAIKRPTCAACLEQNCCKLAQECVSDQTCSECFSSVEAEIQCCEDDVSVFKNMFECIYSNCSYYCFG